MVLSITSPDPLGVLSSTKKIVDNPHYLIISAGGLDLAIQKISAKLSSGLDPAAQNFGSAGNFAADVQLIFLEDAVNFCFWTQPGRPKWTVEYPGRQSPSGGWYSLTKCFHRALDQNIPILDAGYLQRLTLGLTKKIFAGDGGVNIPLVGEKWKNLVEAGSVLKQKYHGQFVNVVNASGGDAVKLINIVCRDFPSFRDKYFLKRAQILANDLSYLDQNYPNFRLKNLPALTAFADYKLPQILRHYGVLAYSPQLAARIDNYKLIKPGSRQEAEIRAATIWAVEIIRLRLKKYTAAQIDNALWLLSQDQTGLKPHHRVRTIFY